MIYRGKFRAKFGLRNPPEGVTFKKNKCPKCGIEMIPIWDDISGKLIYYHTCNPLSSNWQENGL